MSPSLLLAQENICVFELFRRIMLLDYSIKLIVNIYVSIKCTIKLRVTKLYKGKEFCSLYSFRFMYSYSVSSLS